MLSFLWHRVDVGLREGLADAMLDTAETPAAVPNAAFND